MSAAKKFEGVNGEVIAEACALIESRTGVQLGERQYDMAESRLRRRLSELRISSFPEYREYLRANKEAETEALVSLLTTHHTYFFREFSQFELLEKALPDLVKRMRDRGGKDLEVWSAACSRGQEVYSLAMHLSLHLPRIGGGSGFRVLGTDVDPHSVKIASNGVYRRDEIKEVPMAYLGSHWARGTGEIAAFVKAKKSIRDQCDFSVANLMDLSSIGDRKFDVIFCRNVFIYFTQEQVKQVTLALLKHLHPGGMLAIGLSESLHGQGLPLKSLGPSIYGRKEDFEAPAASTKVVEMWPKSEPARALRVVCVDDSPSIIALLKKILSSEPGFEVVGTASNGDEAASMISKLKPDVITLDIHMPGCSGIDYLKKHHGPTSPPVVMVTSVSRDDADLAQGALRLGASDFVEKPALNNLKERGEEIRAKLRSAFRAKGSKIEVSKVDQEFGFQTAVRDASRLARVIVWPAAEISRFPALWKELFSSKIPTWFVVEGGEAALKDTAARLTKDYRCKVSCLSEKGSPEAGAILIGSPSEVSASLMIKRVEKVSVLCLGEPPAFVKRLPSIKGSQLLLEERFSQKKIEFSREASVDTVPVTSFAYLSERFFAEGKK